MLQICISSIHVHYTYIYIYVYIYIYSYIYKLADPRCARIRA